MCMVLLTGVVLYHLCRLNADAEWRQLGRVELRSLRFYWQVQKQLSPRTHTFTKTLNEHFVLENKQRWQKRKKENSAGDWLPMGSQDRGMKERGVNIRGRNREEGEGVMKISEKCIFVQVRAFEWVQNEAGEHRRSGETLGHPTRCPLLFSPPPSHPVSRHIQFTPRGPAGTMGLCATRLRLCNWPHARAAECIIYKRYGLVLKTVYQMSPLWQPHTLLCSIARHIRIMICHHGRSEVGLTMFQSRPVGADSQEIISCTVRSSVIVTVLSYCWIYEWNCNNWHNLAVGKNCRKWQ